METDAINVVSAVVENQELSMEDPILEDVKQLLAQLRGTGIHHVCRSANLVAHLLARFGFNSNCTNLQIPPATVALSDWPPTEGAVADLNTVPAENKSRQQSAINNNLDEAAFFATPPDLECCRCQTTTAHLQKNPTNPREKKTARAEIQCSRSLVTDGSRHPTTGSRRSSVRRSSRTPEACVPLVLLPDLICIPLPELAHRPVVRPHTWVLFAKARVGLTIFVMATSPTCP
ncbi:hypothetical protein TIFTF001_015438 [Ficus carica]|uniref:RNase H type-1 domain-containing protein n=1 Tax=Ficus carica TaxID=3494 RepID=A0AA88ASD4_FICCA|nr:hypothetical protein TIFTF001_015438 [Ficus carica]